MHCYFKLGEKNTLVSSETIGKYGKGGYKAAITMGYCAELTSYFDGKKHVFKTDFSKMEEKNTMEPSEELIIEDNVDKQIGSQIIIDLRPDYSLAYKTDDAKYNINRAYHNFEKEVKFTLRDDDNSIEFIPNKHSPHKEYIIKKEYDVLWNKNINVFETSEKIDYSVEKMTDFNEDRYSVGKITSFVLKEMITDNDLLGNYPGIDFYRCKRLCNSNRPIRNIGDIGKNLSSGQMRGGRCHVIFEFEDKEITTTKSMDDCVGVTTVKDINEGEDKMDNSLRISLEKVSKDINKSYEYYVTEKKEKHIEYMNNVLEKVESVNKMPDDEIMMTKEIIGDNIEDIYKHIKCFVDFQVYSFDYDTLKFNYCESSEDAKAMKKKGGKGTQCRSNSQIMVKAIHIVRELEILIDKKSVLIDHESKVQKIMKDSDLSREDANDKYKKDLDKFEENEAREKKEKILEELLENGNLCWELGKFDNAIRYFNEYCEKYDGDCDKIKRQIKTINEEQVCILKEGVRIDIEDKKYDKAIESINEIIDIDIDENCAKEMENRKINIKELLIKNENEKAEEEIKKEKYKEANTIYQSIVDLNEEYYFLDENDKQEIETKMINVKKSEVESYTNKIENCIAENSFKEAKKLNTLIEKLNPTKSDEMGKRIEESEKVYETSVEKITREDVNNLYNRIMNECKTEDIQKIFKVLKTFS